MKERVLYIDHMRGIAILLMVIGHIIQYNYTYYVTNALFNLIYSFHMPLFFIISGLTAEKTTRISSAGEHLGFIRKKALELLLPMAFWQMVLVIFFCKWQSLPIKRDFILALFTNPMLWFLYALFKVFVFYSLFQVISERFNSKRRLLVDLLLVCFIEGFAALCMHFFSENQFKQVVFYNLFFYVGIFVSRYAKLERFILNKAVCGAAILLFCCVAGFWEFSDRNSIHGLFLKTVITLLAFIALFNIVRRIEWNKYAASTICLFGSNTLIIYVSNYSLVNILNTPLSIIPFSTFTLLVISTPIAVAISYIAILISRMISVSPVIYLLLYGKCPKNRVLA